MGMEDFGAPVLPPTPSEPESVKTPETFQEKISAFNSLRLNIIGEYSKQAEAGILDPIDLPEDENLKALNTEFIEKTQALEKEGNVDLNFRLGLVGAMLYVDAGFRDREYLSEVLGFLIQDAQNVIDLADNPIRVKTRKLFADAMQRVRALISGSDTGEIDYDLFGTNLENQPIVEGGPAIDLVAEIRWANERAMSENPSYTKEKDGGKMLVWKYLSDEAKTMWNYQVWNQALLTSPEGLQGWMERAPHRKIDRVPETKKKIKIDKPK